MESYMSLSEFQETGRAFAAVHVQAQAWSREAESAELDRLATLSPVEYGRERKAAANTLKTPLNLLDKEIEQRQRSMASPTAQGSGQPLTLPEIEAATDPVNGAKLLSLVTSALERYVVLPQHASLAIALWILRSHADDCFDTNPRLALLSPEKRCGKTTLLELISKLVTRALPTSNVTSSVIFRTIEAAHPTLLIDEVDSFSDAQEELRGILNSGHRRETARVIRNVGDAHEPRAFSTWCPMVLAAIGRLPSTIEDRSVIVPMRRRAPHESIRRLRWNGKQGQSIQAELRVLARGMARWTSDHQAILMQCEPVVPEILNDRAADNWSPLLAIAETIGGEWAEKAREAARALSGEMETDTASAGVRLLGDIRDLFQEKSCDRFSSQQLCDFLAELEERPWAQWRHGKALSPHQLAKLLRAYKIASRTIREGGITIKGYHLDLFTDAFSRYLSPLNPFPPSETDVSKRNSVTIISQSGDEPLFEKVTGTSCDVLKNNPNPAARATCDGVTVQNQEFQEEEEILEGEACS
jgi:putative DNA primase/helicase